MAAAAVVLVAAAAVVVVLARVRMGGPGHGAGKGPGMAQGRANGLQGLVTAVARALGIDQRRNLPGNYYAFVIDFLALQRLRRARLAFLYDAKALGRCRPLLLIEIISGLQEYLSGVAQIVRS
jgi:hypothetical protein